MSHLELRGMGASGWEVLAPWMTVVSREEARREQRRKTEEMRREQARIDAEASAAAEREATLSQAVMDLRDRVKAKVGELEEAALNTVALLEKARRAMNVPELSGDPILEETAKDLGSLEAGAIQVQAMASIDTGASTSTELAESYSSAQAALIAMQTISARASAIYKKLVGRVQAIKESQQRAEELRQQRLLDQQAAERRERAEQIRFEQQRALAADEAERQQRLDSMRLMQQLDSEIAKERRLLNQAKYELELVLRANQEISAAKHSAAVSRGI